jgi:hypothetical protein
VDIGTHGMSWLLYWQAHYELVVAIIAVANFGMHSLSWLLRAGGMPSLTLHALLTGQ